MPLIQVFLTHEQNQIVAAYRLKHNLENKRKAIQRMIDEFKLTLKVET